MKHRTIVISLLLGWFGAVSWCGSARGDGGAVRLLERRTPYMITVFTSPTPFRAGLVDISVLVQELERGELVPDAEVSLELRPRLHRHRVVRQSATRDAAANKILRAAVFELPDSGWWDVSVLVKHKGKVTRVGFAIEADGPPPRWLAVSGWLAWPWLVVLGYVFHQFLVQRKVNQAAMRSRRRV